METKQRRKRGAAPKRPKKTQPVRKKKTAAPVAEVVYTPAKPFQTRRFFLRMGTVAAIVLALVFGISIFFKVETVAVSGNETYSAWDVMEASGIREGDNLLTMSKAKAAGLIRTALPYVDTVRIGIKLPGTVNIEITELDVVYAANDSAGGWWYITSKGRVVEKTNSVGARTVTNVKGVTLESPIPGKNAFASTPIVAGTTGDGETQPPALFTPQEQLDAALLILQALEENSVLGEVKTVDVTDLNAIIVKYGDRFTVELGDASRISYKIQCMAAAIRGSMKEYDRGTLDVSFTLKPNELIYTPDSD